jgi:glycosyltransferase involved in cell wall biosynthesis
MARIVIDAREYGSSTGRYVRELLANLEKLDQRNVYTVLLHHKDYDEYRPQSDRFTKTRTQHVKFTLGEQTGLCRQIRTFRPDLVHFTMTQQPILYQSTSVTTVHDLTAMRFGNPAKNPVIFWARQQVYKWLAKRVAQKSASIITPTEFVKKDIAAYCHIPLEKVVVTHEAANLIGVESESIASLAGKKFLMYTGRSMPHKNLARLIEAFVHLQKMYPELWLVLAGKKDANYARHERLVVERGIKNVLFTGYVSEGELRWLYEHCAAYVFPSLSEGFGLPGLEAMVHGAPVVSSNATCLPEVYGDAAHYFDPLNVDDIARKITEVLDNQALRNNLIARGHAQAATYSWRRMAEQTLAVYEACLAKQT